MEIEPDPSIVTLDQWTVYAAAVVARRDQAVSVPFREVLLAGWEPALNDCHKNVDAWVCANPGHTAMRGWLTEGATFIAAHSVVRAVDGQLFDITPVCDGELRPRFIEHTGDDTQFFRMVARGTRIHFEMDPSALLEGMP